MEVSLSLEGEDGRSPGEGVPLFFIKDVLYVTFLLICPADIFPLQGEVKEIYQDTLFIQTKRGFAQRFGQFQLSTLANRARGYLLNYCQTLEYKQARLQAKIR